MVAIIVLSNNIIVLINNLYKTTPTDCMMSWYQAIIVVIILLIYLDTNTTLRRSILEKPKLHSRNISPVGWDFVPLDTGSMKAL